MINLIYGDSMEQIENKLETNEYMVTYSNRMELVNDYNIQVIEVEHKSQNINPIKTNNTPTFKIKSVGEIPLKTIAIFLRQKDSFVGFVSSNIYRDNTASLIMSGINYIPLPPELDTLRNYLLYEKKQDVALYVDEKYQGQGNGKKLIYIILRYLSSLGITNVKVSGITDERALKTYTSTGAIETGNKTAIYENIKQIVEVNEHDKKL